MSWAEPLSGCRSGWPLTAGTALGASLGTAHSSAAAFAASFMQKPLQEQRLEHPRWHRQMASPHLGELKSSRAQLSAWTQEQGVGRAANKNLPFQV